MNPSVHYEHERVEMIDVNQSCRKEIDTYKGIDAMMGGSMVGVGRERAKRREAMGRESTRMAQRCSHCHCGLWGRWWSGVMTSGCFVVCIGRVNIFENHYSYVALDSTKNDCLDDLEIKILQNIQLMYLFFTQEFCRYLG